MKRSSLRLSFFSAALVLTLFSGIGLGVDSMEVCPVPYDCVSRFDCDQCGSAAGSCVKEPGAACGFCSC